MECQPRGLNVPHFTWLQFGVGVISKFSFMKPWKDCWPVLPKVSLQWKGWTVGHEKLLAMKNSSLSTMSKKNNHRKDVIFFSSDVTLDLIFQITNYLGMFHHYNNHSGIYINVIFIYTYIHLHTFKRPSWIKPRYFLRLPHPKRQLCKTSYDVAPLEKRWKTVGLTEVIGFSMGKYVLFCTPNHGEMI